MRSAFTLIAAVLLASPHVADAQVGKLLKKAKDKTADAAAKALETKPGKDSTVTKKDSTSAVAGTSSGASAAVSKAPVQSAASDVLVMDATTIDEFVGILKQDADRRANVLVFWRAHKTYSACVDAAHAKGVPPRTTPAEDRARAAKADAAGKEMERLTNRMQSLVATSFDSPEYRAADDSSRYAMTLVGYYADPSIVACPVPTRPPADLKLLTTAAGETFEVPFATSPVLPAGWSKQKYGLARERVALFLVSPTQVGPPLLSKDELDALSAKRSVLAAYTDYFKLGAMPYLEWSDVFAWK